MDAEAVPWDEISRIARFRGGAWRPIISHCVLLGSSGKRFPCLWKINLFEYSETRYPLKVSTGTSHRVRPVRHLRHEQQPETWTFLVSPRALWIVTPLKLRRKVPYISLLEEMVSSRSLSRPAPHWTSHMIGHKNNKTKGTNNAPIPEDNEQYCFRMPLKLEVHKRYWTTPFFWWRFC